MSLNRRTAKIMEMASLKYKAGTDPVELSDTQDDSDDSDYVPSSVLSSPGSSLKLDFSGFLSDHDSTGDHSINNKNSQLNFSIFNTEFDETASRPIQDKESDVSPEIPLANNIVFRDETNKATNPSVKNTTGNTEGNTNSLKENEEINVDSEFHMADSGPLPSNIFEKNNTRNNEGNINSSKENKLIAESEFHMSDTGLLPFSIPEYLNAKVATSKRSKRIWDKRDFCLYCYEDVTNFSRHLMRQHKFEVHVQQFMKMRVGSIERKHFIDMLRKKGNFLSPAQKEIKLVKRPIKNVSPENILACTYCKGYYMKRYLKRHVLKCRQRPGNKSTEKFNTADAQTYLAFRCVDDTFLNNLRLKEGVLNMRCDSISLIAKSDPLILSFGSFYAKRHRHNHLNKVTKNKLRELARLWQNMKLYTEDKNLFEALKPENFRYFVLSTKNITGYDEKTQQFKNAPSLALHMGTTLKKLCEHAFSEVQQKNVTFINGIDSTEKSKQIKILLRLINNNWNAEVSSVTNQNLVENQWKKANNNSTNI